MTRSAQLSRRCRRCSALPTTRRWCAPTSVLTLLTSLLFGCSIALAWPAGLTCRVWAQKGIEPTEEEVKGKKLALTPLTALPEELILFQRVLQLFRGVRTSVFDACQSTRAHGMCGCGCSCAHRTPCPSTSSSTSLRSRCATFRARTDHLSVGALSRARWSFAGARLAERWRVP